MQEEYDIWTRKSFKRAFPREYSSTAFDMKRVLLNNIGDFKFKSKDNDDSFLNIFSQFQKSNRLYDTIFIDIDEHEFDEEDINIKVAYNKYVKIINILEDAGIITRNYFTGRGFHVYIDFPEVNMEHYNRVVRDFIAEELGIKSVDKQVLGDRNRMSRLVGSLHAKTGFYMIRISSNWDLDTILMNSAMNRNDKAVFKWKILNEWISAKLLEKDKSIIINKSVYDEDYRCVESSKFIIDNKTDIDTFPPCIRNGIYSLLDNGELEHNYRIHIVLFLLRLWDMDRIIDLFRKTTDFNEEKTRANIQFFLDKSAEGNEYYPYSCKKCKQNGFCPYEDIRKCPFKFILNGWIGSMFRDAKKMKERGVE